MIKKKKTHIIIEPYNSRKDIAHCFVCGKPFSLLDKLFFNIEYHFFLGDRHKLNKIGLCKHIINFNRCIRCNKILIFKNVLCNKCEEDCKLEV